MHTVGFHCWDRYEIKMPTSLRRRAPLLGDTVRHRVEEQRKGKLTQMVFVEFVSKPETLYAEGCRHSNISKFVLLHFVTEPVFSSSCCKP
jgi:hypothetical protein